MEYRLLLTAKGQGTQSPALFAAKKKCKYFYPRIVYLMIRQKYYNRRK